MKITKRQLSEIFSQARQHYTTDPMNGLEAREFNICCILKAASSILELDLEFPTQKDLQSIDDRNS